MGFDVGAPPADVFLQLTTGGIEGIANGEHQRFMAVGGFPASDGFFSGCRAFCQTGRFRVPDIDPAIVEFDIDSHNEGSALAVMIGWSFDHDPAG